MNNESTEVRNYSTNCIKKIVEDSFRDQDLSNENNVCYLNFQTTLFYIFMSKYFIIYIKMND